jgi:hypothetical protein
VSRDRRASGDGNYQIRLGPEVQYRGRSAIRILVTEKIRWTIKSQTSKDKVARSLKEIVVTLARISFSECTIICRRCEVASEEVLWQPEGRGMVEVVVVENPESIQSRSRVCLTSSHHSINYIDSGSTSNFSC